MKRPMGDVHPALEADDACMSTYRITVQGELSPPFASHFEGMTLESGDGATVLVGDIVDQAQLQGLLSRLGDLGLVLLHVSSVPAMVHPEAQPGERERAATNLHAAGQGGRS
jgi:hypothetical protein